MKKTISSAQRRRMDYLRRQGLKVGQAYERRLARLRGSEVRRVLALCAEAGDDADTWESVIRSRVDESYLTAWTEGLFRDTGLPRAKAAARDINKPKAEGSAQLTNMWLSTLTEYGKARAGENIIIVSGTLKDTLVKVVRDIMEAELELGIEKLTKRILKEYGELQRWQVRRIAQTESMIAMAEASDMAVRSLDVEEFTKQWCCSGLANSRDTHIAVDGQVLDSYEPFLVGTSYLMYPHDSSMGAEASEIINCACDCIRRAK